ncbi:MAG: M17 family peptidase N-terminal domain-containing protein, partial [Acetobacteraceae bacterium]
MLDIAFAPAALPRAGALILPLVEGTTLTGLGAAADEATGGALARALASAEFSGAKGKTCVILAPGGGLARVVAVGLGKPAELTPRRLEEAGGASVAAVARHPEVAVAADGLDPAQASA